MREQSREPVDFVNLYRQAFEEFGASALWSSKRLPGLLRAILPFDPAVTMTLNAAIGPPVSKLRLLCLSVTTKVEICKTAFELLRYCSTQAENARCVPSDLRKA
jgi:hypothetical protein